MEHGVIRRAWWVVMILLIAAVAAQFKLMWSSRDFPPEPVSPMVLSFDPSDPAYAKQSRIRAARELVGTLRCTRCHAAGGATGAMPELSMDAPSLVDVGARL